MTDKPMKNWVAECQYPGRRSFWVGSFTVPANVSDGDARKRAQAAAIDFMENITPEWLTPPAIIQVKPGAMILEFDDDEETA